MLSVILNPLLLFQKPLLLLSLFPYRPFHPLPLLYLRLSLIQVREQVAQGGPVPGQDLFCLLASDHVLWRRDEQRVQHRSVQPAFQVQGDHQQGHAPGLVGDLPRPDGALAGQAMLDAVAPPLLAPHTQVALADQRPSLADGTDLAAGGTLPGPYPGRLSHRRRLPAGRVHLDHQVGHPLGLQDGAHDRLHLPAGHLVGDVPHQPRQFLTPGQVGHQEVHPVVVLVDPVAQSVLLLDSTAQALAQPAQHHLSSHHVGEASEWSDRCPGVPPDGEEAEG